MSTNPNATSPEKSDFQQAIAAFDKALPRLLEEGNLGKWVLFSKDGPVDWADQEMDLYDKYRNQIGNTGADKPYLVARVTPPQPEAEVTANWFAESAPERGRNS